MRSVILILLMLFCSLYSSGQSAFLFTRLPSSPHVAAVGGQMVSSTGIEDVSMVQHNPALLDSISHHQFHLQYNPFLAGINRFTGSLAFNSDQLANSAVHLTYLSYGQIDQTDDVGNIIGSFTARQYNLGFSRSFTVSSFSIGATANLAASQIAGVNDWAFLTDIGGLYRHPRVNWSLGMVFRNVGISLTEIEGLRFAQDLTDLLVGSTIKPEYMPFRFTVTLSGLPPQQGRLEQLPGVDIEIQDRLFAYVNVGTSLVLSRTIEFTLGYNHLRRTQLRLDTGAFGAGFSYGAILRIKDFEVHFSQLTYNAAGGTTFIGIQNNFQSLNRIF